MSTWAAELDGYAHRLTVQGYAESTTRSRVARLRRFAAEIDTLPWLVTARQIDAWLATQPAPARKDNRIVLRSFFEWGARRGLIDAGLVPAPVAPGRALGDVWGDAIAAFRIAERSAGRAESTIRRRVNRMERFAIACDGSPWHVTTEDVEGWLQGFDSPHVVSTLRDALRAFYAWAARTGRVHVDPTAFDSRRALRLPVPEVYAPHLAAFERALRSAGHPTSTIGHYIAMLRKLARDCPTLDPVDAALDDLLEWMGGKTWARETRRSARSTLRVFFRWMVATGRRKDNPAEHLPKVRTTQPVARPASEDAIAAALDGADDREALAIRLAAELGMRAGEVARVHSRDVIAAADGDWLIVHGKGDKQRRVPLPHSLAVVLRSRDEGHIFPGQDAGHISPHYMSKLISRRLPEGLTMHTLRHRFATRTYAINRDVFTVQSLLGHASPDTTQRYVRVPNDAMRSLVEQVGIR